MENLLAALIIWLCAGDNAEYYVQDYAQDCHHYLINCAVRDEFTEQTVRECYDNRQSKIVKNSKLSK